MTIAPPQFDIAFAASNDRMTMGRIGLHGSARRAAAVALAQAVRAGAIDAAEVMQAMDAGDAAVLALMERRTSATSLPRVSGRLVPREWMENDAVPEGVREGLCVWLRAFAHEGLIDHRALRRLSVEGTPIDLVRLVARTWTRFVRTVLSESGLKAGHAEPVYCVAPEPLFQMICGGRAYGSELEDDLGDDLGHGLVVEMVDSPYCTNRLAPQEHPQAFAMAMGAWDAIMDRCNTLFIANANDGPGYAFGYAGELALDAVDKLRWERGVPLMTEEAREALEDFGGEWPEEVLLDFAQFQKASRELGTIAPASEETRAFIEANKGNAEGRLLRRLVTVYDALVTAAATDVDERQRLSGNHFPASIFHTHNGFSDCARSFLDDDGTLNIAYIEPTTENPSQLLACARRTILGAAATATIIHAFHEHYHDQSANR